MFRTLRGFSQSIKYGHAVGRIQVREGKLLNWQRLERLIESSYEEGMRVIAETDYGQYLEGALVSADIDRGLMRSLATEYRFLDEIACRSNIAKYLHYKYDFHNMKAVVKEKFLGETPEELLSELGSVKPEEIKKAVEEKDFSLLDRDLGQILERSLKEIESAGPNSQVIDTVFDREYLETQYELAKKEKSPFLLDYSRARIDLANFKALLRARLLGKGAKFLELALANGGTVKKGNLLKLVDESPEKITARLLSTKYGKVLSEALEAGGQSVKLTSLDKESDDYLVENLNKFQMTVGVEPILKYMSTRENEVVALRIIFMGKLHGVSPQVIEERLSTVIV